MSEWRINVRGAGSALIVRDYECPVCGYFEATVARLDPAPPCPRCGGAAEARVSAPKVKVELVTFVRGKPEAPRSPRDLDTTALAEGMGFGEFKAKRAAMWRDHDLAELKAKT